MTEILTIFEAFVNSSKTGEANGKNETEERSFFSNEEANDQKIIGFIIPNILDYFSINLLNGAKDLISEIGCSLLIKCSQNREMEANAIRELLNIGVDGIIIFPVDQETYSDEILMLKVNRFPLVLVDRYLPGVETNYVISNNTLGAELATAYIYDLGHRNIAICSSTLLPTSSTEDRVSGYMNELKNRGELINPELIISDVKIDYEDFEQNEQLLSVLRSRKATAYITTESKMSMYIYQLCMKNGVRVPEDVSIISFDDPSPEFGEYGFFTHISQSEYEMGYEAANTLVNILQGEQNSSENGYKKIVIEPKLVVRKSTGIHEKSSRISGKK